jgi:threonyl-tRNA synthetase
VKLEKLAGAYRQADENNAMMTRVYGLCFENKQALKDYETMMEEAKKRDHRVLGKQLELFSFDDEV